MWHTDILKKHKYFNKFIILVLLSLVFTILYFLYFNLRSQTYIYISVYRGDVPYWVADVVSVSDKDLDSFRRINAEVLDKEQYDINGPNKNVLLILRSKVIKDRSGTYLFKNKPLLVGGGINLILGNVQWSGTVVYLGLQPPIYKYKKLLLTVKGKQTESWITDSLNISDTMTNNKGQILAKVLEKKVTLAEVRVDTASGLAVVSYDKTKRDIEAKLEILTKEINGEYYFIDKQKIKVDEAVTFYFKGITIYPKIISIDKVEDVVL